MLADERFKVKDYKRILKNLKRVDARKYEPTNLFLNKKRKIEKVNKIRNWQSKFIFNKNEVLVFGPAESSEKEQQKNRKIY